MDLRQLRYFVVLADELHFRRAAERLSITQAPLSIAIQTLERELGGKLFHRTQRRVALTEVGEALRGHAIAVLERLDRGVSDIRDMVSGNAGQLRIGFTAASALLPFFPQVISAFRQRHPRVRVILRDLSSAGQIAALQAREIDIGIIRSRNPHPPADISLIKLVEERLMAVLHCDHPLAGERQIGIASLRDQPIIFYPAMSGIGFHDQFMRACVKRGFTPRVVQEASDSSTIVGLVATGLGIAVVPPELECVQMANVVFRPLTDDDAVTDLLLACRAGDASNVVATFRHMAQAALTTSRTASAAES